MGSLFEMEALSKKDFKIVAEDVPTFANLYAIDARRRAQLL